MELKERDRELNEMAVLHKKQICTWETDRKRVMQLEEKHRRMEGKRIAFKFTAHWYKKELQLSIIVFALEPALLHLD